MLTPGDPRTVPITEHVAARESIHRHERWFSTYIWFKFAVCWVIGGGQFWLYEYHREFETTKVKSRAKNKKMGHPAFHGDPGRTPEPFQLRNI